MEGQRALCYAHGRTRRRRRRLKTITGGAQIPCERRKPRKPDEQDHGRQKPGNVYCGIQNAYKRICVNTWILRPRSTVSRPLRSLIPDLSLQRREVAVQSGSEVSRTRPQSQGASLTAIRARE